jgi:hypothetical protein
MKTHEAKLHWLKIYQNIILSIPFKTALNIMIKDPLAEKIVFRFMTDGHTHTHIFRFNTAIVLNFELKSFRAPKTTFVQTTQPSVLIYILH